VFEKHEGGTEYLIQDDKIWTSNILVLQYLGSQNAGDKTYLTVYRDSGSRIFN
jgi:hypothetical protein